MITQEIRARIRRLHLAEHWPVGTIANELGLHHETVELALTDESLSLKPKPIQPRIIDPYKDFIQTTLKAHPRLRATRLFQMIQSRGYPGGIAQVRRYVRLIRPSRVEAFFRLRTLPGEQGQVDWGSFGKITVGYARRSLSCFVMVLSYSRGIAARFFYDQTLSSFLSGHVAAFEVFGGVPRQLFYDNLKSVVVERIGDHVRYHPRLLELAGHYHFAPVPCAPYRANEKGKVERTIQYLRSSFFAARTFRDLDDLNAQLQQWIQNVAHLRRVPADPEQRLVKDALAMERERLLPLPQHPFSCDVVLPVKVSKYPYVRFDLNDYSVPHDRVGRTLTLCASADLVRIVDAQNEILAEHLRSYDRGMCIEDRRHLADLAKKKRHVHELRGRDRLRQACPKAEAFFESCAQRGSALGAQSSYLSRLLDRYGPVELDSAIAEALTKQAVSAASVAHILDQRTRARQAPPPLETVLPDDERVKNLHLVPHALEPYDQLALTLEEDDDDHRSR